MPNFFSSLVKGKGKKDSTVQTTASTIATNTGLPTVETRLNSKLVIACALKAVGNEESQRPVPEYTLSTGSTMLDKKDLPLIVELYATLFEDYRTLNTASYQDLTKTWREDKDAALAQWTATVSTIVGYIREENEHLKALSVGAVSQTELEDAIKDGWGSNAEASRKTVAELQAVVTPETLRAAGTALTFGLRPASVYWPEVLRRR